VRLKIALVVHGRFHAFDLARELLRRGHDVMVFTNYPKWAVKRFEVPVDHVRSFWQHGVLSRASWKLGQYSGRGYSEAWLHSMFGRWARAQVAKESWDVVHPWSGIAEEVLRALEGTSTLRVLMRCSSHIRTQARLLQEEEARTETPQDRPDPWTVAREEREYALADRIAVLSTFSFNSFIAEGVPAERLMLMLPGARLEAFRPTPEVVEDRCRRILAGEPLRVLNVGTFSLRKGMWDMAAVVRGLQGERFAFRFVGPVAADARRLAKALRPLAEFVPKQPQPTLPSCYAWGDAFVLPTIEDGFQYVVAQAGAAGLPILTTPNGAGSDIVREGQNGWLLPIRSPQAFVERLRWCAAHRQEMAAMARDTYTRFRARDWSDLADDFVALCQRHLGAGRQNPALARR
jgi:glycosyltransferase involved in cell wall biosynthesis